MATLQTLRQQTALIFEEVNTPIEIAINFAILALSILSLTIFVVQTYDIPEQWRSLKENPLIRQVREWASTKSKT
ncbi:MAG: hypothetical protein ACKO1W_10060 [Microcystaceae cyanobacterium]